MSMIGNREKPLVSIGIATYNRPELLFRTLNSIVKQTYNNLEIIISDDAFPGDETRSVVLQFMEKDSRIKYYRQKKNLGSVPNHHFVLEKATGQYFIWVSDDDYFKSEDLIDKLLYACKDKILAFPDFIFDFGDNGIRDKALYTIYGECRSDFDYLCALCKFGYGNPVHGLFNLERLKETGLSLEFDDDLTYHNEGTLLHKIFLNGNIVFVPGVYTYFEYSKGSRPELFSAFKAHTVFSKRLLLIHLQSNLRLRQKIPVLRYVITSICIYEFKLFKDIWKTKGKGKIVRYMFSNPISLLLLAIYWTRFVIFGTLRAPLSLTRLISKSGKFKFI